jgi:hypothetical protein
MFGITSQSSVKGISNIFLLESNQESQMRCLYILSDLWITQFHLISAQDLGGNTDEFQTTWKSVVDLVIEKLLTWTIRKERYFNHDEYMENKVEDKPNLLSVSLEFLLQIAESSKSTNRNSWIAQSLFHTTASLPEILETITTQAFPHLTKSIASDLLFLLKSPI